MTIDPAAIKPVAADSWLLDLDMFRVERRAFDVAELMNEAQRFAERTYAFFRWTVTDGIGNYQKSALNLKSHLASPRTFRRD